MSDYTMGHVGSFYFGGSFVNGIAEYDPPTLSFEFPLSAGVSATAYGDLALRFEVPDGIAIGVNAFDYEFSATMVSGSSPMYVEFEAYNYLPKGRYEGIYSPVEFRWWFDYGVTSGANDYESSNSPSISHLFCGNYGDEYDVRLIVIYA